MDTFFEELGNAVLKAWKGEKFSLSSFPQIAVEALEQHPPAERVDLGEWMRGFLLGSGQPAQTDSPFGEPELVVYKHSKFYIQLLFWMDGTTAIHQHSFSGAFHVMHGSSIHAHYEFKKAKAITPHISVGEVRMTEMEILETGRTVPIISGAETIHSLFHLDSPSVTVVVRTQHDAGSGPQFNYLSPGMAIDPLHSDLLTVRQMQLLDVLAQSGDEDYAALVMELLSKLDFERGFYILQNCMGTLQQLGEWEPAIKLFKKKHGKLAEAVEPTLQEEIRRDIIKSLRGLIVEPEHRFFLALLMNAPSRDDLLKLVAQRFPDVEPVDVVLRWAEELMEGTEEGVTILDAIFPEVIEVDRDSQPELFLTALLSFISPGKKRSAALKDLKPAEIKALRRAFTDSTLSLLTA